MNLPNPTTAALESIRHWRDKAQLAAFAIERHGFGDSDGGFGITYPSDLDECVRETNEVDVPTRHVLAYGFGGENAGGYDVLVPESIYHRVLANELEHHGLSSEARLVRSLNENPAVRCHRGKQ